MLRLNTVYSFKDTSLFSSLNQLERQRENEIKMDLESQLLRGVIDEADIASITTFDPLLIDIRNERTRLLATVKPEKYEVVECI